MREELYIYTLLFNAFVIHLTRFQLDSPSWYLYYTLFLKRPLREASLLITFDRVSYKKIIYEIK